jgi:hypothetical protein
VIALKNKKFLLGFCALLVAVAMVSVGLTLALTTVDKTYTTNVVTIGEVKIELIDNYYDTDMAANGQTYTKTNPPVFEPNKDVTKTIKVKNVGNYPCYVRLLVQKEWIYDQQDPQSGLQMLVDIDAPNGETEMSEQTIQWNVTSKWVRGLSPVADSNNENAYLTEDGQVVVENEMIRFDDRDWDYCYYYQEVLAPGASTDSLFVGNKFHIGDYSDNKTYASQTDGHIYVAAQAIQSDYVTEEDDFGDLVNPAQKSRTIFTKNNKIVKWNDNLLFE